jgi:hypothetical protein
MVDRQGKANRRERALKWSESNTRELGAFPLRDLDFSHWDIQNLLQLQIRRLCLRAATLGYQQFRNSRVEYRDGSCTDKAWRYKDPLGARRTLLGLHKFK